ncbi:Crp/Fnr family transcriptional regulator [Robertkochia sediminum]|uniref:Crp/Fnr family transcriptional regulator n=1 Tax=Robertkochia sediminum TaxID=2785326 RepID=UPI0019311DD1|nr:Crp/Fnr family transcriptional regulator [Robertkochia sediminum]MBL7471299.1 Crp/Fnr family transcriptional regulator [Robertkochia sediminum]
MSKCEQCIIRQFSSLNALNKSELIRISECKETVTIKKGEEIFREGQHLDGVYCIKSGICKLTKLSDNGRQQIIKFVKTGDLLGQRTVVSNDTVNLSAIAVQDMEVCFIPKQEINQAFQENQKFSGEVIKVLCNDLREADNTIVSMAQKPVKERLAYFLLHFNDDFGVDDEGFLAVQLSREEIAGMVGTATESLIRMLSEFGKKGLIQTKGKRIKIVDNAELERLAEGF